MEAHSVQRIYFSILYLCFGGYGLLIIYGNVDKTKEKPISTSQRSWLFTTQRKMSKRMSNIKPKASRRLIFRRDWQAIQ